MSNLFCRLVDENLYKDWAILLDWLFDDDKFQNWSAGYVGSLTKKIKRLPLIGKDTYCYESAKNIKFPKNVRNPKFLVLMTKGDGEAKDLIRHIRNGIAHGKTNILKINNELYIEIIDYTKKGTQSAYICIPISYITQIQKLFLEVKKSKDNDKKSTKKK